MLSAAPLILPEAPLDEAKAYLRIAGGDEDVLLARLLRSAAELCERITGQALISRNFSEVLGASGAWTRLGAMPVLTILTVEALPPEGAPVPLAADAFAVDIDAKGEGWVRIVQPVAAKTIRVSFEAGLAPDWVGTPEALRQGILRLAAHLYTHRGGEQDEGPPAAVTALWRPWRRMRLA